MSKAQAGIWAADRYLLDAGIHVKKQCGKCNRDMQIKGKPGSPKCRWKCSKCKGTANVHSGFFAGSRLPSRVVLQIINAIIKGFALHMIRDEIGDGKLHGETQYAWVKGVAEVVTA